MRYILLLSVFFTQFVSGQGTTAAGPTTIASLKKTVYYLADDKLEGRRTGSKGEELAYGFIEARFRENGLGFAGTNTSYLQAFEVKDGRTIDKETSLRINGNSLLTGKDFFPIAYSANTTGLSFNSATDAGITLYDAGAILSDNKGNPHFDLKENVYAAAKKGADEGKKLFVIFNSSTIKDELSFDTKDKTERLSIPVIYITDTAGISKNVVVNVSISEKIKYGHNVIGYINNGAAATIVLGAHYDHLGYGEDHNSLYTGPVPMIHNGADDNASGVAALIELSKWLKTAGLKNYNYAFVAFSGEELGLHGSKYFTDHSPFEMKTINYMLNMDMVGRLNDSTHGLTIGGYGTSPVWGTIIKKDHPFFRIKEDSSGVGPSDHTSFYRKDIPVLFFFTGSHSDYHKPSDDAEKINFNGELEVINYIKMVLTATDLLPKLPFTKTRDAAMGKNSFRVSLGIMPDYTFDGAGVRVDGVSDNRPAQKAGILTGDVLYQLGEHTFTDVETYMQVLNKFNKGDATKVKLKRGKEEIVLDVTF